MNDSEITSEEIDALAMKMTKCIDYGMDPTLALAAAAVFFASLLKAAAEDSPDTADFWAVTMAASALSSIKGDVLQ